jgi:hypothetical protein
MRAALLTATLIASTAQAGEVIVPMVYVPAAETRTSVGRCFYLGAVPGTRIGRFVLWTETPLDGSQCAAVLELPLSTLEATQRYATLPDGVTLDGVTP